jgi:hypothetical protein
MPTSTRSPQCSLATSDYGISGDLITPLPEYWTGSGENSTTGIKDPTLDGLIKTLSSASDQNMADDLLRRVQRRIGASAHRRQCLQHLRRPAKARGDRRPLLEGVPGAGVLARDQPALASERSRCLKRYIARDLFADPAQSVNLTD